jgi:hypothetical protein
MLSQNDFPVLGWINSDFGGLMQHENFLLLSLYIAVATSVKAIPSFVDVGVNGIDPVGL